MDTYGAILKKRIKEMGYTQEQFAEETGVPYGTLKKYLSDKACYPIDLLKIFAEKLDCSYDYLMGYSVSTSRNLQSVKDATRLSDRAIEKLMDCGRVYDEPMGNMPADALSRLLESEDFIELVALYIYPGDVVEQGINEAKKTLGMQKSEIEIMEMNTDSIILLSIINQLMLCKNTAGK